MNIPITDAELPIMQLLWKSAPQTSTELLAQLEGNDNTQKTLLKRLVEKGAVYTQPITSRTFSYAPAVSKEEYEHSKSETLLHKVFGGSSKKMLLSFVEQEKITKKDLQELLDMIEGV